jgi:hypothetical protein
LKEMQDVAALEFAQVFEIDPGVHPYSVSKGGSLGYSALKTIDRDRLSRSSCIRKVCQKK